MQNSIHVELSEGEVKVLKCLKEAGRAMEVHELAEQANLSLSSVMSYLEALNRKGLVKV
ncbi:MAG: hypothetical protein DRJ60_04905, partial [Thermoprotei archaeon]